jgi:hypothetical protein
MSPCLAAWGTQETDSNLGEEHLLGVIEAHFANLASWDTGDVLVRVRTTGSGTPEGAAIPIGAEIASTVFEQTGVMRFTFDFPRKRFVGVISREREIHVFDALDNEINEKPFPERHRFIDSFLIDESRSLAVVRGRTGQFYQLKPSDKPFIEIVRDRFGVLNFKGAGIGPTADSSWNEQQLKTCLDLLFNADVIEKVSHVGKDQYRTFSRVSLPAVNVKGYRRTVDWDVVYGVPVRFSEYAGYDDDAQASTNSAQAEWFELNSQMMPRRIRENRRKVLNSMSGRQFIVDQESEVDFHWFSINEQLPDDLFEERQFKEPGRIARLLSEHQFENLTEKDSAAPQK